MLCRPRRGRGAGPLHRISADGGASRTIAVLGMASLSANSAGRAGAAPVALRGAVCVRVVLPVYGEGAHGTEVAAQVSAFAIDHPEFEFLFVNDGSRDDTAERVAAGIDRRVVDRVRVRSYGINGGKGWAVLRGVAELCEHARDEDAVIFTDGDLAYSLDHLRDLARALEGADVAIGSRREVGGEVGAHTARRWMGWLFNRMARWVVGWPCRDTQAGLKGFRASAARRIFAAVRETGFAFDVELLHIARRLGYRVAEVPARVSSFHRHIGSSVNLLRDPLRMVRSLARVSVNGALGVYERAAEGRQPIACVSFDAEEFDIPREFGAEVPAEDQFAVAAEGMRRALAAMDEIAMVLEDDVPVVTDDGVGTSDASAPLVSARGIALRHPAATHDVLRDITLDLGRDQHVALTGAAAMARARCWKRWPAG